MKSRFALVFVSISMIYSSGALAQPGPSSGPDAAAPKTSETREAGDIDLAMLMAFEVPGGRVGSGPDGKAREILGGRFVLGLDLGVRLAPSFRLSGRAEGFIGALGTTFEQMCDAGREASKNDPDPEDDGPARNETCAQFGAALSAHGRYDFRKRVPVSAVAPWVSFGVGVETLTMMGSSGGSTEYRGSFDGSFTGVNYAIPELGLDWRVSEGLVLAMFVSAKVGRYTSRSGTASVLGEDYEADFGGSATHTWIGGGLALSTF